MLKIDFIFLFLQFSAINMFNFLPHWDEPFRVTRTVTIKSIVIAIEIVTEKMSVKQQSPMLTKKDKQTILNWIQFKTQMGKRYWMRLRCNSDNVIKNFVYFKFQNDNSGIEFGEINVSRNFKRRRRR